MYYMMIALMLTGCAFKGDGGGGAGTGGAFSQGSRTATISWNESGGSVNRSVVGERNFSIADPISVPTDVPDEIHIVFNAPLVNGKLLQEPRVYISDATDASKVEPPLRLAGILEPSGILISGLKTFLSPTKQQKGVIRVSLMNAVTGDEEASLGFTLVSTPTVVGIERIDRTTVHDASLKKLTAPQERLDLALVVKNRDGKILLLESQKLDVGFKCCVVNDSPQHEKARNAENRINYQSYRNVFNRS